MSSSDTLRILTSVELGPLKAGMQEAAAAVQTSTKQMEASFKEAEAASRKTVDEKPVIVYHNAVKQVTAETEKMVAAEKKVSAEDLMRSRQHGIVVYEEALRRAGLTQKEVAEQSLIYQKLSMRAQEEEYLALLQVIEAREKLAATPPPPPIIPETHKTNITETRHALVGLGELAGVQMPRHISTFLAHLAPVSAAMSVAFAPIAVVGLIAVIAEIPEQLEKGINALRGWNDEAKKSFREAAEAATESARKFREFRNEIQMANATAGLVGMAKLATEQKTLQDQLGETNAKWNEASKQLHEAEQQLKLVKEGHHDLAKAQVAGGSVTAAMATELAGYFTKMASGKEIEQAEIKIENLKKRLKELGEVRDDINKQSTLLGIDIPTEAAQNVRELGAATIDADQKVAEARLETARKRVDDEYKLGLISLTDRVSQEKAAADQELKNAQAAIAKKRALALEEAKTGTPADPRLEGLRAEEVAAVERHRQQVAAIENAAAVERKTRRDADLLARVESEKLAGLEVLKGQQEAARRAYELREISAAEETRQLLEQAARRTELQRAALNAQLIQAMANGEKNQALITKLQGDLRVLETAAANERASIRANGAAKELADTKARLDEQVGHVQRTADAEYKARVSADQRRLASHQVTLSAWQAAETAALEQWHNAQTAALNRQVVFAEKTYGAESKEYAATKDRMIEIEQRYANERDRINDLVSVRQKQSLDRMTQSWNAAFRSWLIGQRSFGSAMAAEWNSLVANLAMNILKMGEQWIAGLLMQKAMAKQGVLVDAKKAATGAYSAVSGIPFVGPVLAPVAAATAFTAVMAFGSFARGGVAQEDMMGMMHRREMVLDPSLSIGLQNMIRSGSPGANVSAPVTYSPTIIGDKQFIKKALESHPRLVSDSVKRGVRSGSIRAYGNSAFANYNL